MYPENNNEPGGAPQQPPVQSQPPQPTVAAPTMPPTTPQPSVVSGSFVQSPMTSQPTTFTAASQQKPPKKLRWLKRLGLGFLAVIILAALAFGWHTLAPKLMKAKNTSAENKQLNSLVQAGNSLTDASLAKLDKTDLFFGVFKHASEQQVVATKLGYYFTNKPHQYGGQSTATDTTMNYATKQFSYDSDIYMGDSMAPDKTRCIDSQPYHFTSGFSSSRWEQSDSDSTACSFQSVGDFSTNDGINTGGLTSTQADTFVAAIRQVKGLVKVNSATVATHNSKNYIKFDVTITPVKLTDGYYGMQNFMWAFKDTGLDPAKQPYSYLGSADAGMRLTYYVDPTTQLPAYAQLDTTGQVGTDGKVKSDAIYDYRHVEYTFGGQVPTLTLNDHNPIQFSWPTDKL